MFDWFLDLIDWALEDDGLDDDGMDDASLGYERNHSAMWLSDLDEDGSNGRGY